MINNLASWLSSKFCEEPKIILLKYRPTDAKVKYFKVVELHLKSFLIKFTFQFHSSSSTIFSIKVNQIFQNYYNEIYPVISI